MHVCMCVCVCMYIWVCVHAYVCECNVIMVMYYIINKITPRFTYMAHSMQCIVIVWYVMLHVQVSVCVYAWVCMRMLSSDTYVVVAE